MTTDTMKAWRIEHATGLEALQCAEVPRPRPRVGEALVRVAAAALNFSDLLMLRGAYQIKPPLPFSPGQEIAGTVVESAGALRAGDRIASKVEWGGFAEYVCVREDMAIRVPETLSFPAAATLPVVWPTAWIALHERGALRAGESVLVHAAAGGVGLACLQLARAAGARPLAVVGDRAKFDVCRANGAAEVMSYADPWVDLAKEHGGADVVVDPVGGSVTEDSLRCIARGGRLLIVGFSSGEIPRIAANRLLLKNAAAIGVYWSHDWGRDVVDRAVNALLDLHARGAISLAAQRTYGFDALPQALADLAARTTVGKSVLTL